MQTTEDEERVLRLLEATHTFPGDYTITVIAVNREEVSTALMEAVERGETSSGSVGHVTHESRGGRYLSHRFTVACREARDVLGLYARVKGLEGIITVL